MARICPHCGIQVGSMATTCWKCKLPLEIDENIPPGAEQKEKVSSKNYVQDKASISIFFWLGLILAGIGAVLITFLSGSVEFSAVLIIIGGICISFGYMKSLKSGKTKREILITLIIFSVVISLILTIGLNVGITPGSSGNNPELRINSPTIDIIQSGIMDISVVCTDGDGNLGTVEVSIMRNHTGNHVANGYWIRSSTGSHSIMIEETFDTFTLDNGYNYIYAECVDAGGAFAGSLQAFTVEN